MESDVIAKRSRKKMAGVILCSFIALIVFLLILINSLVSVMRRNIKVLAELRPAQGVLVPGAKVSPQGRVSDILHDRIISAYEVYAKRLVSKILVSGDHGTNEYDEVNAMKQEFLKLGVPEEDIFMDHAGFSTYDSLYRARAVFQVQSLIIVTQKFHLPRSLFIAGHLGIPVQGYKADKRKYVSAAKNEIREFLARVKDFFMATLFLPEPKYLGRAIPITGDGRQTQD